MMKSSFIKKTAFALFGVVAVVLAVGTVVEKVNGSFGYSSPVMVALWTALAVASVWYMTVSHLQRRPAVLAIHMSLLVILLGAFTTWLTKEEGRLVLGQGEVSTRFTTTDGGESSLPFTVELKNFEVVYYPATNTPADFVSHLEVTDGADDAVKMCSVSMNHPLDLHGYRLFQSGYGSDGSTTILTVNHDPYGTGITYFGYALLLLSFVAYLLLRGSVFRATLCELRRGAVAALLCLAAYSADAAVTPRALPADVAYRFCDLLVNYNGRVCMAHTLARDFTAKICGSTSIDGYTAEQVFTGWMLFPEGWNEQPIVKVKDAAIREALNIDGSHTSMRSFFDDYGEYRLKDMSRNAMSGKVSGASATMDVEDKINLVNNLTEGRLLKIFPCVDGTKVSWYAFGETLPDDMPTDEALFVRKSISYFASLCVSGDYDSARTFIDKLEKYQRDKCGDALPSQSRLTAENIYNNISQVRLVAMLLIVLSLVLLADYCASASKGGRQHRHVALASTVAAACAAIYVTLLIALRWYVSGHVPMSNGYETMLFMSWCAFPLAFVLKRYGSLLSTLALMMCGLCLMVAGISQMNPQISPLVPVLQSPLLCVHVAVIMLAYCLLAFMMLVGVVGLVMRYVARRPDPVVRHLALIGQAILVPAVMLLAVGIFVGAVWAGFSWGRYWGWDPKEVWALITLMVYSVPLHTRRLSAFSHPLALHVFMAVAFLSVLVTYFGVNYLLGGMHSYA